MNRLLPSKLKDYILKSSLPRILECEKVYAVHTINVY